MGPSGMSGLTAIANLYRVYSGVDHSPKEPRGGERGVTEYLVFHVWSRESAYPGQYHVVFLLTTSITRDRSSVFLTTIGKNHI